MQVHALYIAKSKRHKLRLHIYKLADNWPHYRWSLAVRKEVAKIAKAEGWEKMVYREKCFMDVDHLNDIPQVYEK